MLVTAPLICASACFVPVAAYESVVQVKVCDAVVLEGGCTIVSAVPKIAN